MDAKEFVNQARNQHDLISLSYFDDDEPLGKGEALIVDETNCIAVMLTECNEDETGIGPGAIVQFRRHPEAEPRIVGQPADLSP